MLITQKTETLGLWETHQFSWTGAGVHTHGMKNSIIVLQPNSLQHTHTHTQAHTHTCTHTHTLSATKQNVHNDKQLKTSTPTQSPSAQATDM